MDELFLTPEHLRFKEEVRAFAQKEIAPRAVELDRAGPKSFPYELMRRLGEKGLLGITYPKEYGGLGRDFTSYVVAMEEVTLAYEALGPNCQGHLVGLLPIYLRGTKEQKEKYLRPGVKGEKLSAFALVEPQAGSDAASIQSHIVKAESTYILNGKKAFISNAGAAEIYVVIARTKGTQRHQGVHAFIVEKGTPGFTIGNIDEYLGMYGHITGELLFEDCRIPSDNLLGDEGDGFKIAMETLDRGRVGECAQALSIAQNSLQEAIRFARGREQFGKKIAEFQAIQFMLADMAMNIDAGRLLVYRAARLIDQGKKATKEASMGKLFTSEVAMKCAIDAVEILGARGLTKEYPVERYLRAAKICSIVVGTSEIQRIVISRELLK